MLQLMGRDLIRWFVLFTFWAAISSIFPGCGSLTRGEEEPLQISLQEPGGDDLFWFEVQDRVLKVTPQKGEPQQFPWSAGTSNQLDLREGDKIEFLGIDRYGNVKVTGESVVGQEKKITIELHRVL